jgi:hypothetical protein
MRCKDIFPVSPCPSSSCINFSMSGNSTLKKHLCRFRWTAILSHLKRG